MTGEYSIMRLYTKEDTKYNAKRTPYCDHGAMWTHNCIVCGDEFQCNRMRGKYCSSRCANDAAIQRRQARMAEKRAAASHCTICGAGIEQDHGTKIRKYCSNSCKQKAYRARKNNSQTLLATTSNES